MSKTSASKSTRGKKRLIDGIVKKLINEALPETDKHLHDSFLRGGLARKIWMDQSGRVNVQYIDLYSTPASAGAGLTEPPK